MGHHPTSPFVFLNKINFQGLKIKNKNLLLLKITFELLSLFSFQKNDQKLIKTDLSFAFISSIIGLLFLAIA